MSVIYTVKIITHSMNVRKGPSTSNAVFDWVQKGETYTSSKTQNGWYYIDSLKGWINGSSSYVSVTSKTTTPTTNPTSSNQKPATTQTDKNTTVTATPAKPGSIVTSDATAKNFSGSASNALNGASGIGSSSGTYTTNTVDISTGTKFTTTLEGVSVNPNTTEYVDPGQRLKIQATGMANFAEYRKTISLSNDKANIAGMSSALNTARQELNVFSVNDKTKVFNEFNRYKTAMPGLELHKGYPYIFFTRPDIDILDPSTGKLRPQIDKVSHTFAYLYNENPEILRSINSKRGADHQFNTFLSNMARSFDPADEVIRTIETGETYTGYKTVYARNTNESNSAGQFNIQYRDNRNLDALKMHKAWVEYMNAVYRGAIDVDRYYIHKKILNYACSMYYIVCGEDGESIIAWTKYYGVFPINSPMSTLGWSHGSPLKMPEFTISYMYALKDDFDPVTLAEFNQLSTGNQTYRTIYNPNRNMANDTWHKAPYIDSVKRPDGTMGYKLRFRN